MFRSLFKSGAGLAVIFTVFALLSLLISFVIKGVRLDLTQGQLYTLSAGTKAVLAQIKEPVTLEYYFSSRATSDLPALRTYATRVDELLQEYVASSQGKITLKRIDPEPFSEAEDDATQAGLQGVPSGRRDDPVFFGLVGRSAAGEQATVPFFQMEREPWLEYELTKLIHSLDNPEPPVVGIISGLQVNGGFDFASRSQSKPWVVIQQLDELFELKWLDANVENIEGVDVLMLIHPAGLSDATRLAIDQFVLKGGKLIAFLDPHAESVDTSMGMMMPVARRSDLPDLLQRWGVRLSEQFVGDFAQSMMVSLSGNRAPVRHIGLLGMGEAAFASEDVILGGLSAVNASSVGWFETDKLAEGLSLQVLLQSSAESMPLATAQLEILASPEGLLNGFKPTGIRYPLAVRLRGQVATAFPDGVRVVEAPAADDEDAGEDAAAEPKTPKAPPVERLIKPGVTEGKINVLLVADTDLLNDRLWVQVSDFYGQQVASPWADNGSLVVNAVDHFAGSEDLISIRNRGRFTRPFDRVQDLRRDAEVQWLEKQQTLQQRLEQTDARLAELDKLRAGDDGAVLSPEQQSELLGFQHEKLAIRRELRDVQHQLDQDIEQLGSRVKLINIVLMPLLMTLGLVLLAWGWRRVGRR